MISKKEIIAIIILVLIALVRFFFFLPKTPDYTNAVGNKVTVEGIVTRPPDVRLNNIHLTITPKNQEANILVITSDLYQDDKAEYGDFVKVVGVLESPENFVTTSGKEFNYERYLANQDIYFIIKNTEVEILSKGNGNKIKSVLYKFRDKFISHVEEIIDPPESDLASGLVLGTRGGFDNATRDEFISTGTIHIVALSGYNVTIVAEGVMRILGLILAQSASIVFGIIVIVLFIIMAGASSTAIRAGVMATILLFARMTGRTYSAGRALVIAGLVMIAYDPRVLTDISFQLSFLATGGVLFITPKVIRWVRFLPMQFGFRELVSSTIGATIAVLPLLLYTTGILSIVSLPANILILPLIPITMLFVFLTGMLGFISTVIALPFAYISHLLLSYILSMIHFFASLPFTSVTIQTFPLILTIVLYGLLIWWVLIKRS